MLFGVILIPHSHPVQSQHKALYSPMSSKALSKKPTYAEVVSRSVSPPLAPLAVSGARSKARDDSRPSQLTEKADIVDGLQGAATSEVAQSGKMEVSGGRRSARSDGVSVREQSRRCVRFHCLSFCD